MNYTLRGVLLWLFLPSLTVLAQNLKVDSLEQALSRTAVAKKQMEILHELAKSTYKDFKRSTQYSDQLLLIAEQENDKAGQMTALKDRGLAQGFNNDYASAIQTLLKSSDVAESINDHLTAGENYTNIGSAYYVVFANFSKAIEYYLKALDAYEKANDRKGIASALSGIGTSYNNEHKFDQALDYLNRSLAIMQELGDEKETAKVLVSLGGVYDDMGEFDKALPLHQQAFLLFEKNHVTRGMARSLYSMADIHTKKKEWEEAIANLTKAVALDRQTNHQSSVVEDLVLLGKVLRNKGDHDAAEKILGEAVSLAIPLKKKESLSDAYGQLAEISEQRNDYKQAYNFERLHIVYHDSVFSAEQSKQIAEMQARFDTERKQLEIEDLKEEKAINQVMMAIVVAFTILTSVIGFLIINRQKMKMRNQQDLADKESQIMEERKTLYETELKNNQLMHESLQSQIDFKNKELASYTLNLIRKNEILENVKECAEEIRSSPEQHIRQKLTSLINLVNYSVNSDKEWDTFKVHFEQVHPDFFRNLLERHSDLTHNDLKLCALLKMNLDNRGMAMILNISQESVKVAKHRLRKKLCVPSEENLVAYLATRE